MNTSEEKVTVFAKRPKSLNSKNYKHKVKKYSTTQDIGWDVGDVTFLDNEAIKGTVVGFPSACPITLVALDKPKYWLLLFIGVLRRILIGQVKIKGIVCLKSQEKKRKWLYLTRLQSRTSASIYFSSKLGIEGLLNHLRKKKINYVIMRFYQKLPNLYRKGGDLDILVCDKDEKELKEFLVQNPGNIRIDIWNVSAPTYNGITYFIPRLSQKILKESILGPANSRIPSNYNSLISLIYHALYHKGLNSGIKTTTPGIESIYRPNNDYSLEINKIAKKLNLNVGSTMEELEEFLNLEGWKPKIDTLAKIAQWNEWVRVKNFDALYKSGDPISVFILRKIALTNKIEEKVKELIKKEGFKILDSIHLLGEVRVEASKHLRGGTWKDAMFADDSTEFEPGYAIIIMDLNMNDCSRFVSLKQKVRKRFDFATGPSIVHSTDNEAESWDYINYCFPGMENKIRKSVEATKKNKNFLPMYKKLIKVIRFFPYYKTIFLSKIRTMITNKIIN